MLVVKSQLFSSIVTTQERKKEEVNVDLVLRVTTFVEVKGILLALVSIASMSAKELEDVFLNTNFAERQSQTANVERNIVIVIVVSKLG